jgi:hypothetical protein
MKEIMRAVMPLLKVEGKGQIFMHVDVGELLGCCARECRYQMRERGELVYSSNYIWKESPPTIYILHPLIAPLDPPLRRFLWL